MINLQTKSHWIIGISISVIGVLLKNHVGFAWLNDRQLPWLDLTGIFIATIGLAVIAIGASRARKRLAAAKLNVEGYRVNTVIKTQVPKSPSKIICS